MAIGDDLQNTIDIERLTPIVRCALSAPGATVLSWRSQPIAYASVGADSRGLFRVFGTAATQDQEHNWAAILKVFRPLPDGSTEASTSAHYWKREVLAYTSGLLDALPEGVGTPRCYKVEEMADGSLWLWMEQIVPAVAPPWPLSRFGIAAYHLGLFNGQYLAGRPLPQYDWLSNGMTRIWAQENAYTIDLIGNSDAWMQLSLSEAFPQPVAERLLRLWKERETFYATLDRLPQTICHHDAGHRNLYACRSSAGCERTVLIDWELVGYGAIGEELGNLFAPALINFEIAPEQAEELAAAVLDGYLEGLRAAGWRGDIRIVRLGFAISAVFRWTFAAVGWPVAIVTDQSGQAERQTLAQWGRPIEQVYRQWAGLTYYLLGLADEAERQ